MVHLVAGREREVRPRRQLGSTIVPRLGIVQAEVAGVHAILIRLDRPEGFRALVAREYGAFVWEMLLDAGADLGLAPIGVAVRALLEAEG